MRTIKLVVIGNSGVGKTSLRGQYVSGRFSQGYRASIGADFISKTLPHHSDPEESVTLQIWDTAGQERFSTLSSAFFRGADAALLMYDVTKPDSLHALERWWSEFRDRAPVPDEELEQFCVVVVGNKTDLVPEGEASPVSERDAQHLMNLLVPPLSPLSSPLLPESDVEAEPVRPLTLYEDAYDYDADQPSDVDGSAQGDAIAIHVPPASEPISLGTKRPKSLASRRSNSLAHGTMSSVRTGLSMYHTPSSSVMESDTDYFQSARGTPLDMRSPTSSLSRPGSRSTSRNSGLRHRTISMSSTDTASTRTSGAMTITPSLFTRKAARSSSSTPDTDDTPTPHAISRNVSSSSSIPLSPTTGASRRPPLSPPDTGPRHFRASAKSGEGVATAFEYVAERVVKRWEWAEAEDARTFRLSEAHADGLLRLDDERGRSRGRKIAAACCSS
ncbi:ras-domain-containing protein [Peniophora sp. CONT]|nr:ras-domain-containing protein [Peniophora sp. CONT]